MGSAIAGFESFAVEARRPFRNLNPGQVPSRQLMRHTLPLAKDRRVKARILMDFYRSLAAIPRGYKAKTATLFLVRE